MKRTYDFGYRVKRKGWWRKRMISLSMIRSFKETRQMLKKINEEHCHISPIDHTMPLRLYRIVYDQPKGDKK